MTITKTTIQMTALVLALVVAVSGCTRTVYLPATTTEVASTTTTEPPITTTTEPPTTTTTRPPVITTEPPMTTTQVPSATTADRRTVSCQEIAEWAARRASGRWTLGEPLPEFLNPDLDELQKVWVGSTREVSPPSIRDGERVCATSASWFVRVYENAAMDSVRMYACANRDGDLAAATGPSDPEDCLALLRGER